MSGHRKNPEMVGQNQVKADISDELACMSLDASTFVTDEISPMSSVDDVIKRARSADFGTASQLFASGRINLLDPLLYMRIRSGAALEIPKPVFAPVAPTLAEIIAADRERTRLLTDFKPSVRKAEKRKEVSSSASVPRLPVCVFKYCQMHGIKYTVLSLKRSFRSVVFNKKSNPWESFIELNMLAHYRLCHSVYFGASEGSRVVCLVPHSDTDRIDPNRLSQLMGGVTVERISLTMVEKELRLPTFVVPPFQIREPGIITTTFIDASLTVEATTDCIFELGNVALRIRSTEMKRIAEMLQWNVVVDLAWAVRSEAP